VSKLINKTTFKTRTIYNENLSAVHKTKPGFLEKFDTSTFPVDHPCYRIERKKVPGTLTDETGGQSFREQIALRAKSYGFDLAGKETTKAKGVAKTVVKHHMTTNLLSIIFSSSMGFRIILGESLIWCFPTTAVFW